MSKFPHLPLKDSFKGDFKFPQTPRPPHPRTAENRNNSRNHGAFIGGNANSVKERYQNELAERAQEGLPHLDENIIPVFLQVDPDGFDIEALKGFGIEIIAEEDEGFIIGASVDGFKSLENKIKQFVEEGKAVTTAQLWEIVMGQNWRVEQILSEELQKRWTDIADDEMLVVDVSIACYIKPYEFKARKDGETEEKYQKRRTRWEKKDDAYFEKWDDLASERQDDIDRFLLTGYGAERLSGFVSEVDSFGFSIRLPGKALKDFVLNYPYVFEVIEKAEIDSPMALEGDGKEWDIDVYPPLEDAPKVCIVDSGIMEGHRLLAPAVLAERSRNFVPDIPDTVADEVVNGGHGTRVAGAVLYGNQIPKGIYQPPCYLYNARVLNRDNQLSSRIFPPELMEEVCDTFKDAHIFNVSINHRVACRTTHMSQWAASLDRLTHKDGHIFVVSAGNIKDEDFHPNNPGIKNHRLAGRDYPAYLFENASRIANPAQSLFSITVGSVCLDTYEDDDHKSFGERDYVSSFSRCGLGMWNSIKPELVEYGGDWVTEKRGDNFVVKDQTCPELVVSKGAGVSRDSIGTSFAAPKVSHILAQVVVEFPEKETLFHKALLIQSALLPEHVRYRPLLNDIRHYGYGIPDAGRALENSERRITFTTSGSISPGQANLYSVQIPEELRRQGQDYDILIEVSLCYTAKNRRTRRRINSYLSSWLSWQSAPMGQPFEAFKEEILKNIEIDNERDDIDDLPTSIPWRIGDRSNKGSVKGINRQSSANQKDWATVKSYDLPDELSFAIVGHKGWEKNLEEEVPYAFVVSFELLNGEIPLYELMAQVNVEVEQESQISLF